MIVFPLTLIVLVLILVPCPPKSEPISKLEKSKSGLYFCCREHKDLAQKINAGESFKSIRPTHYKNGIGTYRENAFFEYPH